MGELAGGLVVMPGLEAGGIGGALAVASGAGGGVALREGVVPVPPGMASAGVLVPAPTGAVGSVVGSAPLLSGSSEADSDEQANDRARTIQWVRESVFVMLLNPSMTAQRAHAKGQICPP
jgi:hypothetical protein